MRTCLRSVCDMLSGGHTCSIRHACADLTYKHWEDGKVELYLKLNLQRTKGKQRLLEAMITSAGGMYLPDIGCMQDMTVYLVLPQREESFPTALIEVPQLQS